MYNRNPLRPNELIKLRHTFVYPKRSIRYRLSVDTNFKNTYLWLIGITTIGPFTSLNRDNLSVNSNLWLIRTIINPPLVVQLKNRACNLKNSRISRSTPVDVCI